VKKEMDSSYQALHKFLLPNTKLEDVMVNMNDFKNEASKPQAKTCIQPSTNSPSTDTPTGVEDDHTPKPVIPRLQKRLNERIQHKLSFREERKQKKETAARLEKEERLRRIKEEMKAQSKISGFREADLERIKRIVHGVSGQGSTGSIG
jgi:hypothetical protein